MLRYVITITLINLYSPCTGIPVTQNVIRNPIANQLQQLANSCENLVISDLINKQIQHCNVSIQASESKTEFRCLMFYDINSQLCTAFHRSTLNLEQNYRAKMSESQNLKTLCDNALSWQFIYKDQYPKNIKVDEVFKDKYYCVQMCANDEILSSDSNYFCKYYQWGTDLIKNQAANMTSRNTKIVAPVAVESNLNPVTNNTTQTNVSKNDISKTSTHESVPKPVELPEQPKLVPSPVEVSSPDVAKETNQAIAPDNANKGTAQSMQSPDGLTKDEIEKPPAKVDEAPQQKDPIKDTQVKDIAIKEKQLDGDDENLEQDDENDDEPEYDQVEAAVKAADSDPGIEVKKTDSEKTGNKVPLVDSDHDVKTFKDKIAIESITAVAEVFPNPMQDTFVEDDDKFFRFFVSTIITVVVLYILYHNRTKILKVFVGLLVEGRVPGRRRNSRGHSYRRLDTLEQAMSTNSAAPPSKIIY